MKIILILASLQFLPVYASHDTTNTVGEAIFSWSTLIWLISWALIFLAIIGLYKYTKRKSSRYSS